MAASRFRFNKPENRKQCCQLFNYQIPSPFEHCAINATEFFFLFSVKWNVTVTLEINLWLEFDRFDSLRSLLDILIIQVLNSY